MDSIGWMPPFVESIARENHIGITSIWFFLLSE
nr:MAG TPA: hypothetical protein [Caudoviricetes sp.]